MVENLNLSSLQHMSDDDWLHMFVSLNKLQHLATLNLRNNDFKKVNKYKISPSTTVYSAFRFLVFLFSQKLKF